MVANADALIEDFHRALVLAGLSPLSSGVEHDILPAPHRPVALPTGKCAVYVFSLAASYGRRCPAGEDRVLKVGRIGPNSQPRFQYQHYKRRAARSTLAKSLVQTKIVWPYLGVKRLKDVGRWIKANTDRDHFFLDAVDCAALCDLERYLRARLGPVFEGG